MRFLSSPAPASTAPGLGPANLAFLSRRLGFVATTGGAFAEDKVGYIGPSQPGLIERTTDGGVSWTVVLRAPHVVFERIGFADALHGLATGNVTPGGCCGAPPARPIVFVTDDGGHRWRGLRVPAAVAGDRFELPALHAWYAIGHRRLLVSVNEGRTWSVRSQPRGAALVRFPSASVGYAAVPAACGEELYRTDDGAVTWAPLAGTCASSYSSLDFIDSQTGWVATGGPAFDLNLKAVRFPVTIRRTVDGGATWTTVYRSAKWYVSTSLRFTDARYGWADTTASFQSVFYAAVYRTTDGGETWHAVPGAALPSAFAGADDAWSGDQSDGLLWRTTDGGRTWRFRIRPEYVLPRDLLIATRTRLVIDSTAGTLRSDDGGATWRSTPPPSARAIARALREPAYIRPVDSLIEAIPELSPDSGRTWRTLRAPAGLQDDVGDLAFSDPDHGLLASGDGPGPGTGELPVYATDDGGRTWRQLHAPRGVQKSGYVTPVALGPGVLMILGTLRLYLSTDEGRQWLNFRYPGSSSDCGVSRPRHATIWILCSSSVQPSPSLLLRSDDGGASWRKLTGPVWLDAALIAFDGREAWTLATNQQDTGGGNGGPVLWHTTDGGSTWREVWPNVPGEALRAPGTFGAEESR